MALITLRVAASRLGVAAATLRAQIRRGRLKATKFGRDWLVEESEVARYAQESRRPRKSSILHSPGPVPDD